MTGPRVHAPVYRGGYEVRPACSMRRPERPGVRYADRYLAVTCGRCVASAQPESRMAYGVIDADGRPRQDRRPWTETA